MSRTITLLFALFSLQLFAQQVVPGYRDGYIYVKLSREAARPILNENPRNIPVQKVEPLKDLLQSFGISKITRPFWQASDDKLLPLVLRVEFKNEALVNELISQLENRKGIDYAEKVPLAVTHATPNDFSISSASVHLSQINAPAAWNYFNGNSNITVAIVDNAVMWTHADLIANTYTNTGEIPNNNIDDDGNGFIDDVNGFDVADYDNDPEPPAGFVHGTHCAGIAGARTDNATGVASIGWNLKIIPVKAEPDAGSSNNVSYGYEGIIYASRSKARIISCSWGSTGSSFTEQVVINYAWNRGSIIIASAGNNGNTQLMYPAAYNHVYAVASVTSSDIKSSFSTYGTWVDISAPGSNIYSLLPYTGTPAYGFSSGTSMAAPMVAGLAGLMLSHNPHLTRQDVLNCISSTAVNIYSLSGNSAYNNQLGAGRIDAAAAMSCAAAFSVTPPVANFSVFPRLTCPNTPVQFTDSSLYLPTAWSWTFQGGTPATSTLANPIVQYSSNGTYSVGLTVTNAYGSSTKIKNNYIVVSGPVSPPFVEGFQGNFLPANWSARNIMNDSMYWERVAGVGGYGTSTACAMFNNYTYPVEGERDEMLTPKFTFTHVALAKLRFDVAYARYDQDFSDTLEVKLSTDCGSTWTSIYLKGGSTLATAADHSSFFVPTSTEWRTDSIDISSLAAGQNNVMFSFVNRGHFGQPIYIDNINLFFPTPTISVAHAAQACEGSIVSFTNTTLPAGSYSWTFQGGTPAASTSSAPLVSFSTPGIKTFSLMAVNGTSSATATRTIDIVAMPTLAVNNATVCSGSTVTLAVSGADSYSWNTGALTSTAVVSPVVNTVYTITGTNAGLCSSEATVSVNVTNTPTLNVTSQTVCPGGSATLTATGASTYSWNTGATSNSIVVSPQVNTIYTVTGKNLGCEAIEIVTVSIGAPLSITISPNSPNLCAGESITLTASGAGTYTWNIGSTSPSLIISPTTSTVFSVTGSLNSCTGTAISSITVNNPPSAQINLTPQGPHCVNQPFTLTASGAQSYSWSGGATSASLVEIPLATGSHVYSVTAFNGQCHSVTTITVPVQLTTSISITSSSNTICAGTSVTLTAGSADSYTWTGGFTDPTIVITPLQSASYTLNATRGNCKASAQAFISVNPLPQAVLQTTASSCSNRCSGILTGSVTSGLPPYSHSISNNDCTTFPCYQLCAGVYTVTTTDANNCSSTSTVSITNGTPLSVSLSAMPNTCTSCNNGTIQSFVTGGIPPFMYSWSNGSYQPQLLNIAPGCYTLVVIDAGQCSSEAMVCVDVVGLKETTQNALSIFPNPASDEFTISQPEGLFDVLLYNNLSQLIYSANDNQGSSTIDCSTFARGSYVVIVRTKQTVQHYRLLLQ